MNARMTDQKRAHTAIFHARSQSPSLIASVIRANHGALPCSSWRKFGRKANDSVDPKEWNQKDPAPMNGHSSARPPARRLGVSPATAHHWLSQKSPSESPSQTR